MKMANSNNDYWDINEFNFFSTLDDVDKLLYIYDLMIGEFVYEYEGTSNPIEFDNSNINVESNRVDVQMEFTQNEEGILQVILSGADGNIELLKSVGQTLVLNGMILTKATLVENPDWKSEMSVEASWNLRYDLIGNVNPISVN